MRFLILITLLTSCGMNHKISGVPSNINTNSNIRLDFQSMSDLCNERYSDKEESDACFEELVNFFDSEASLDLNGIKEYCESLYEGDREAILECNKDILKLLKRRG